MNYENTKFKDEIQDKESALELDSFLEFYEWAVVKYPNGKYNIKDEQCNTFDFEENTTLNEIIKRVYFRMLDYFMDEQDIEELLEGDENDVRYANRTFETYMKIGKKLNLLTENDLKDYRRIFNDIKNEIELNNEVL